MRTLAVLALLGMIASPLSPAFGQPSGTITVKGKKEPRICKVFDAPTGSRVGQQRICKTKAQWDLEDAMRDRNLAREDLRFNAENSQRHNEENALGKKMPH